MKASKFHSNKNFVNWLVYNIHDKFLDKLDRNWSAEAQGFYVVARKC